MRISLIKLAQQSIQEVLLPGDCAIDATMGNGHDTLFLTRIVGDQGKVFAFDIQSNALELTRARLKKDRLSVPVSLNLCSHGELLRCIPNTYIGKIKAIMFNLGYLPGSDKSIQTNPQETVKALSAALILLSTSGCISIVVYTGHPGGLEEAKAVKNWLKNVPEEKFRWKITIPSGQCNPPELIVISPGSKHKTKSQ